MAGYIGKSQGVTQVDGYTADEADSEFVNDPNAVITVDGSNVGIGTSSPSSTLHIKADADSINDGLRLESANGTQYATIDMNNAGNLRFYQNGTSRMRIDSSGNLLVGKTSSGTTVIGVEATQDGRFSATRDFANTLNSVAYFDRNSYDGTIIEFRKDGSTVGVIGTEGSEIHIGTLDVALKFERNGPDRIIPWNASTNAARDNAFDLGGSAERFDDIYATNTSIQTSDRNEKQDIEELSEAEQRVAVACKGLLRKYRWIDAVAKKGDDARIHFGIIAQDLQDAFAAEGLDAGRYAMFISSTWWETQTEVPAVEAVDAVLDDEGNVIQEAVEAQEAYIRTDTYETAEEAPEGATERTRLGVRYPELLAFIIAAI